MYVYLLALTATHKQYIKLLLSLPCLPCHAALPAEIAGLKGTSECSSPWQPAVLSVVVLVSFHPDRRNWRGLYNLCSNEGQFHSLGWTEKGIFNVLHELKLDECCVVSVVSHKKSLKVVNRYAKWSMVLIPGETIVYARLSDVRETDREKKYNTKCTTSLVK